METIKLEHGWLDRQMKEVRLDVQEWPDELMPLTHLNSAIVQQGEARNADDQADSVSNLASSKSENK